MQKAIRLVFRLGIFVVALAIIIAVLSSSNWNSLIPGPGKSPGNFQVVVPNGQDMIEEVKERIVIVTATPESVSDAGSARREEVIEEAGGIEESKPVITDIIHTVVPKKTAVPANTPTVTPTAFPTLAPLPDNTAVPEQEYNPVVEQAAGAMLVVNNPGLAVGMAIVQQRRAAMMVTAVPTAYATPQVLPTPERATIDQMDLDAPYAPPALKLPDLPANLDDYEWEHKMSCLAIDAMDRLDELPEQVKANCLVFVEESENE